MNIQYSFDTPLFFDHNPRMIKRHLEDKIRKTAKKYPVLTITGPRQSGKTTLAKMAFPKYQYISLEDPEIRHIAQTDAKDFFKRYTKHVIIDEAQRVPDIFSYIQTIVDDDPIDGRFILTGSEQFLMDERISQSLAGRTAIFKLFPFSLSEINGMKLNAYWAGGKIEKRIKPSSDLFETIFKGFYPRIYDKNLDPSRWYKEYYDTYISRDVRQMLNVGDLKTFETFMKLLAGRSGQLLNLSSLGNDAGVTHTTARRWLSILQASYIVNTLAPYYKNFGKRMIKSPKLYFLDCGLLCSLLNVRSPDDIMAHPLRGQIFETFAYSEITKCFVHGGEPAPLYFWQDSRRNEIDILIDLGIKLPAVEIKSGTTINEDFFKNLYHWQKITDIPDKDTSLIYGGNEYSSYKGTQIIPWYGIS